jgi:hypothetical protein
MCLAISSKASLSSWERLVLVLSSRSSSSVSTSRARDEVLAVAAR